MARFSQEPPAPSSFIAVTDERANAPGSSQRSGLSLADTLDWIERSLLTFKEVTVIGVYPYLPNVVAAMLMSQQAGVAVVRDVQTRTIEDPPGQHISCMHAVLMNVGKVVDVCVVLPFA